MGCGLCGDNNLESVGIRERPCTDSHIGHATCTHEGVVNELSWTRLQIVT